MGIACVCGLMAGCDVFSEPDRFFDREASPVQAEPLEIADLEPWQHVAGTLSLALDLDSLRGRVQRVDVYVDSTSFEVAPPYRFAIETTRYSPGEHLLTVAVSVRGGGTGLLGALGGPSIVAQVPLVFDQTPPSPVQMGETVWDGARPRIAWEPSPDPNFYAYLIVLQGGHGPVDTGTYDYQLGGYVVDTLFERSATTWLGPPMEPVYGAWANYQVAVWNRVDRASSSWAEGHFGGPADVGDARGFAAARGGDHFFAEARLGPYGAWRSGLVRGTLDRGAVLDTLDAEARWGRDAYIQRPRLSPDGTRLYAAFGAPGQASGLILLDPETLEERARFVDSEHIEGALPGADGALYYLDGGVFRVVDGVTGAERGQLDAFNPAWARVAGVSPDGRSAYVIENRNASTKVLFRVAVEDGVPSQAELRLLPSEWGANGYLHVLPDGRLIVLGRLTQLRVIDGASLEVQRSIAVPGASWHDAPDAIFSDQTGLYLALEPHSGSVNGPGSLYRFRLTDFSLLREWRFEWVPRDILGSADGTRIHAVTKPWSQALLFTLGL